MSTSKLSQPLPNNVILHIPVYCIFRGGEMFAIFAVEVTFAK